MERELRSVRMRHTVPLAVRGGAVWASRKRSAGSPAGLGGRGRRRCPHTTEQTAPDGFLGWGPGRDLKSAGIAGAIEGDDMTKADLIEKVAKDSGIAKSAAGIAVDSLIAGIAKTLSRGDRVTLVGFGTFTVSKRKARKGRNPQTGAPINIPASKVPRFHAGKGLKDAVN
ncbi:MAG: HU family DNA-binding protein [SAR324 cluster bacterium]